MRLQPVRQGLSHDALASLDRPSEDVRVMPVIVAELELGTIEMQILFADLVKVPPHPRLIR